MSKPLLGLLLGGVLGIFDGLSALVSAPETAPYITGIVIGSTFKGIVTGVLIGWFAKKVSSLPLGILFGLAVGLVLAFLVAMVPSETGQHYYWEIMLPGSLLGMIVGYATQRYGRPGRAAVAALVAFALCLLPAAARADGVDAKAAFERLKGLAGTWQGTAGPPEGTPVTVRFAVTAAGHAVVETQFAGSDHEMVNVYHLADGELVTTHYCSAGNQPRLRLDAAASAPGKLVFAFAGGTSLDAAKDSYVGGSRMLVAEDGRLESEWDFYAAGKPTGTGKMVLRRTGS